MEKMLDKKSRDFAKNMQDTMIYDKDKNEVQIGTNLYVDGETKFSVINTDESYINSYLEVSGGINFSNGFTSQNDCYATGFSQPPTLITLPNVINVNTLPLVDDQRFFDASVKNDVSIINVESLNYDLKIGTGNAVIILDKVFYDLNVIMHLNSIPAGSDNYVIFDHGMTATKIAIINLHGAVYITRDNEI